MTSKGMTATRIAMRMRARIVARIRNKNQHKDWDNSEITYQILE